MQIDFHHTVTYVVARAAGFSHSESETIAYSAQYVDDATDSGLVQFYLGDPAKPKIGPTYTRISSAHKMLDYRNNSELANSRVWLPFHFLPSNDGREQEDKWQIGEAFLPRIISRPNSPIAQIMVKNCIEQLTNHASLALDSVEYRKALSRLGITMHVYADTWAHQDFAGVAHEFNELSDINSVNYSLDDDRVKNYASGWLDKLKSKLAGTVMPLGHGPALSFPDLPFF